jgi:hypothetical protein
MHNQPKQIPQHRGGKPESLTAPQKKPYRSPRLVVYGDLRQITMQKGGSMNDGGGAPMTKA